MSIGLYAGSFDPVTNGHMYVIDTAAQMFDRLIVAVAVNPDKKTTFSEVERIDMLRESCATLGNVDIITIRNEFTVDVARQMKAGFLVRGVRTGADLEYERTVAHVNSKIEPSIKNVVLMPPPGIEDISSSLVKGLVGPTGWRRVVSDMVPSAVFTQLLGRYALKRWEKRHGENVRDADRRNIQELIGLYSQPHRGYHNLNHILHCLEVLEECVGVLAGQEDKRIYWKDIETAIWYHDAVYDPKAGTGANEEASNDVYRRHEGNGNRISVGVIDLIRATSRHFEPGYDPEDLTTRLMLDIDLSSFALPPDEQAKLSAGIRQEYSFVPDDLYRLGRTRILTALLDRPFVYRTDYFRDRYETLARRNIASQILELSA